MRWEDERYVRLYQRDTLTWLSLSLEAQGLLALLLRKLDRAGLLDLGPRGARGVAAAIGHGGRWQTIQPALQELLDEGVFELRGTVLVMPNYVAAQEAKASDRARQQAKRERDRDKALAGGLSRTVTKHHAGSVTPERHAGSVTPEHHAGSVTPSLASLAEPAVEPPLREVPAADAPAQGELVHVPATAARTAKAPGKAQAGRGATNDPSEAPTHVQARNRVLAAFLAARGAPYPWDFGREDGLLTRLLKRMGGDVDALVRAWELGLAEPDAFHRAYTLAELERRLPRWLGQAPAPAARGHMPARHNHGGPSGDLHMLTPEADE